MPYRMTPSVRHRAIEVHYYYYYYYNPFMQSVIFEKSFSILYPSSAQTLLSFLAAT